MEKKSEFRGSKAFGESGQITRFATTFLVFILGRFHFPGTLDEGIM